MVDNKKVLFVATVDVHILTFHLPYLELFKQHGYEVHVATNGKAKIPFCDKKHTISMERSPYSLKNLKAIKELKKIIEKENFEIIHCHTPMGGVVTRLATKKAKKAHPRVIYTAHGFHFYKGAPILNWILFYPVEKYLAKYTDTLITINHEDFERAKNKFSKRCHDIKYISGTGIDFKKFYIEMTKQEKHSLRQSLKLNDDDFVMIFPARLDNNKNQGFLIQEMSKLVLKYPKIHLLLPGKDELEGKYQSLVKKMRLSDNVHFLGNRDDIPSLLQISDLAVSSSKREGLPVNIIEAAISNLPVVVLDCRGMRDLVVDNFGGKIIPLAERNSFSNAVEKMYKNEKIRKQYGDFNKKEAEKYELQVIMDEYKKVYFEKKKVLHILSTSKYSGAENVACTIIDNLKTDYNIAYCSLDGSIKDVLKNREIKFIPVEKISSKEIKRVIREFNPDIIHAHDIKASVLASKYGKTKKVISHIHKNDPKMSKLSIKSILYLFAQRNFAKIIWVSKESLKEYKFNKECKQKSEVIENRVDEKRVIALSKEYSVEHYDCTYCGRLESEKNPLRFIDIIKELAKDFPKLKVAIVGDGSLRKEVEEKIQKYNLNNIIEMKGFVSNPYPILKNTKILCLTSVFEGLPMVTLEASILGARIISTVSCYAFDKNNDIYTIAKTNEEYIREAKKLLKVPKTDRIQLSSIEDYILRIDTIYKGETK